MTPCPPRLAVIKTLIPTVLEGDKDDGGGVSGTRVS